MKLAFLRSQFDFCIRWLWVWCRWKLKPTLEALVCQLIADINVFKLRFPLDQYYVIVDENALQDDEVPDSTIQFFETDMPHAFERGSPEYFAVWMRARLRKHICSAVVKGRDLKRYMMLKFLIPVVRGFAVYRGFCFVCPPHTHSKGLLQQVCSSMERHATCKGTISHRHQPTKVCSIKLALQPCAWALYFVYRKFPNYTSFDKNTYLKSKHVSWLLVFFGR